VPDLEDALSTYFVRSSVLADLRVPVRLGDEVVDRAQLGVAFQQRRVRAAEIRVRLGVPAIDAATEGGGVRRRGVTTGIRIVAG
jgi:hypothetical protein